MKFFKKHLEFFLVSCFDQILQSFFNSPLEGSPARLYVRHHLFWALKVSFHHHQADPQKCSEHVLITAVLLLTPHCPNSEVRSRLRPLLLDLQVRRIRVFRTFQELWTAVWILGGHRCSSGVSRVSLEGSASPATALQVLQECEASTETKALWWTRRETKNPEGIHNTLRLQRREHLRIFLWILLLYISDWSFMFVLNLTKIRNNWWESGRGLSCPSNERAASSRCHGDTEDFLCWCFIYPAHLHNWAGC